jgi:outer membrane protein TolC
MLLTLLVGCTSYHKKPIDIGADLAAWRARSADDARVRSRAKSEGVAYAPSDGLGLNEATMLALVLNPGARIARLKAKAVAASAGLAGRWKDPALSTELQRAIGTGSSPWIARAGLTLTLPFSGRLSAEADGAMAQASAARFAALVVENDLRLAVASAWFDLAQATESRALLEAYLEALTPMLVRAEALSAAGELPSEQLGILQIEAATRRIELAQSVAHAQALHERLLALLGLTVEAQVKLVPQFEQSPVSEAPAGWPQRQVRVQFKLAEYEAAEHAVRREVARQYPDITLTPSFESDRGQSLIGLGLGLIPIPAFNRNKRAIADARGRREVLRVQVEAALQAVVSKTRQVQILVRASVDRLLALEALVQQIDTQLARLITLADHGELDVLVLRHVLQSGLQNQLAATEARQQQALERARLALLYAVIPTPPLNANGDAR